MKMFQLFFVFLVLRLDFIVHAGLSTITVLNRMQYCLQEAKLVDIQKHNFPCYAPLTQGPCDDGQWWVQKTGLTCSASECAVPSKYFSGIGECANKTCELPQILHQGECKDIEDLEQCGKGKYLVVNLKGVAQCQCGQGWAEDANGDCQFLYSQGNCGSGNQFMRKDQVIHVPDIDVKCKEDSLCQKECDAFVYFYETMEKVYGCYDGRCKIGNKEGLCCPKIRSTEDDIDFLLQRLKNAESTRGVCVRNPCPPGEILYHNLTAVELGQVKPEDVTFADRVYCQPANDNVMTCEGEIEIDSGKLNCCESGCSDGDFLVTFGIISRNRPRCRRGYFFHRRRQRCVRGHG